MKAKTLWGQKLEDGEASDKKAVISSGPAATRNDSLSPIADDLAGIQEAKPIEGSRSTGAAWNDERKILNEMLGSCCSASHPSVIALWRSEVIALIEDLVEDIVR